MILLFFFSSLFATEVLIQSSQTPEIQYEKRLMQNPSAQSFIQYQTQANKSQEKELRELLKRAQFEFLQGSLVAAQNIFQDISKQRHKKAWTNEGQKIIHYSLLRSAQLANLESEKTKNLKEAILYSPERVIDEQLFPPPMVRAYNQMKKDLPIQVWPLPKGAERFHTILVNGQPAQKGSGFIRSRPGTLHLLFLSNHFLPVELISDTHSLKGRKLALNPIAEGTCDLPQFHFNSPSNTQLRLVDGDCVSRPAHPSFDKVALPQAGKIPTPPPNNPNLLKNKWFWIGVSAVAAGMVAYNLDQKRNQTMPASPWPPAPRQFSNR